MTFEYSSIRVGTSDATQQLWIHEGIHPAPSVSDDGEPYTDTAHVPGEAKRSLTNEEQANLRTEWHWPPSACVLGLKLDDSIVDKMRQAGDHDVSSPDFHRVGDRLWELICERSPLSSLGPVQWLGVSRRPSGLKTSTLDSHLGCRIGLHIDSWDRLPLSVRHTARIRLCVNLGRNNRSFLFLPIDIATVCHVVAEQTGANYADPRRLALDFFRLFPEYPVLELEVPPGYAYLAPTDNLLHDGRSLKSTEPDVTIAWLGHLVYTGSMMS